MSAKDNSQNEDYFENIYKNYDDEVNKILSDQIVAGGNQVYNHYMNLITAAAKKIGLAVRPGMEAKKIALAICFHLEDSNTSELASEWVIENYDRNQRFYNLVFKAIEPDDEEQETPPRVEEYEAPPRVEAKLEPQSAQTIDLDFVDNLVKLKQVRERQISELIEEVSKKFISADFATNADVVSIMGENKALRQMIVAMFEKSGISFSTTTQGSLPLEIYTKHTKFQQGIPYSLEHLKFGYSNFSVMLDEKARVEQEKAELKTQVKSLETKNAQAVAEAARLRTSVESLGQELEILQAIPKLDKARVISYRVAWDDDDTRYYLGTSAEPETRNEQGLYKVKSLVKTAVKRESLAFKNIETLQAQLERAIEGYHFINRKQLISLVHLKAAFVIETLEYVNERSARRQKIQKSISVGRK